jgi:hypothetical protein
MKAEEILYKHMIKWAETQEDITKTATYEEFLMSEFITENSFVISALNTPSIEGTVWVKASERLPSIGDYYYCKLWDDWGQERKAIVEWAEHKNGNHKYYDWDLDSLDNFYGIREDTKVLEWLDESGQQAPEPVEPILIKAGDTRLLINGNPPLVDCRVVAEERYQSLTTRQ